MRIAISLSLTEIEHALNAALGAVLHEGTTPEGVQLRVLKTGNIVLGEVPIPQQKGQFYLDRVRASVPISVAADLSNHAQLGLLDKLPGISAEHVDFEMRVMFDTQFHIAPAEWDVHTQTSATFAFDKKPTVGVGMMAVNVSRIAGRMVETELENVCKEIDRYLREDIRVREYARIVWETVFKPQKMAEMPETWAWFVSKPMLRSSELTLSRHTLHWLLYAEGEVQSAIGEEPKVPLQMLPRLSLHPHSPDELSELTFSGAISYPQLAAELCRQPLLESRRYGLSLRAFALQPAADNGFTATAAVTLRVSFLGIKISLDAEFFIQGKMLVEDAVVKVQIDSLRQTAGRRILRLLLRAGAWKPLIANRINAAIAEQQTALIADIRHQLAHFPIENTCILRGTLTYLRPESMALSAEGITIRGRVAGSIAAEILIPPQ